MDSGLRIERAFAVAFASARLVFCGYRAIHQSIVVDEAFTYVRFIRGPWSIVYSPYDANNHVLHTILAKLSIQLFGLSELALRLPSLLSGFFLILGIFWVLEFTTSRLIRWIAVLALGLHPSLLDFSIAARGYGMGLAFLVWATCFSMRRKYAIAGVLLGLGVSANLTIVFPALALMFAVAILSPERIKAFAILLAPAASLAFLICYPALRTAGMRHFYIGNPTLRASLFEIVSNSLHGAEPHGFLGSDWAIRTAQLLFLPAISVFIIFATRRDFPSLLPTVTLATAVLGLITAHAVVGLSFPIDRTGLYLPLLFGIAWAIAADSVRSRLLRGFNLLLACLLIAQFATQVKTDSFHPWVLDQETRRVALLLKQACQGRPEHSVSLGASWVHQPALEFYRDSLPIAALQPVSWQTPAELSGHDFYILNNPDTAELPHTNLQILFADAKTGIVFAKTGAADAPR